MERPPEPMIGDAPDYVVEPLASRHDRAAFASGEPSLDEYMRTRAGQDVKRDLAAAYVLGERGGSTIIGYYTLSATSVELTDLPEDLAKQSARYHLVRAVLLGRLAIDQRFQGTGMGMLLLMDALHRTLGTGVGVKLVVVDALNARAANFYARFGFHRFAQAPSRLYLAVSAIRPLFPDAPAGG